MEPPKVIHTHSQLHVHKERRKPEFILRLLIIGIVVLTTIAGLMWWSLQERQSARGLMRELQTRVQFPLYYPSQLPQGMALDRNTFSNTDQVVSTSYSYDKGKRIVVTIQPTGSKFNPGSFQPTSEFTASIGRAYLADLPTRTTAAVVAEKSWVLINAPDRIAIDQITAFINSLRPVQ